MFEEDGTPSRYYLFQVSQGWDAEDGDWEQLTNGFDTYEEAKCHYDTMFDFYMNKV